MYYKDLGKELRYILCKLLKADYKVRICLKGISFSACLKWRCGFTDKLEHLILYCEIVKECSGAIILDTTKPIRKKIYIYTYMYIYNKYIQAFENIKIKATVQITIIKVMKILSHY